MTSNQINYAVHLENKRHNQVAEYQGQQNINESVRHNKVTEGQGQQSINENVRHNRQSEAIGFSQASAAHRQADVAAFNAQTQYLNYQENQRHNQRQEEISKYGHDVTAGKFTISGMGFSYTGNQLAPNPLLTNESVNITSGAGFYPILSDKYEKFRAHNN